MINYQWLKNLIKSKKCFFYYLCWLNCGLELCLNFFDINKKQHTSTDKTSRPVFIYDEAMFNLFELNL